ncbi:hypothetical protein JCM11251_000628 [Rhodosporidiobolus azoricus]
MSLPGAYTSPTSDSDSSASLSEAAMQRLEEIAALDTDSDYDADYVPGQGGDDEDDFMIEEEGETEGEEGEAAQQAMADDDDDQDEQPGGAAARDGGQLSIGIDPGTGLVFTIGANGQARRLTARDLAGTNITLGAIRAMLQRRFGGRVRLGEDDEEEEEGEEEDEMEEDEDDDGGDWWGPTRRNAKQWYPMHTSPHPSGEQLLRAGAFGPPPAHSYGSKPRQTSWIDPTNVAEKVRMRELGQRRRADKVRYWGEGCIPNSDGVEVSQFTSKVYSGQYSSDGRFFYSACQDFRVYIYDTATPPRVGSKTVTDTSAPRSRTPYSYDWEHRSSLKVRKIVQADPNNCRWTLTDAELSDDNEWLVYSSISPRAHLVKTGQSEGWNGGGGGDEGEQETLNFAAGSGMYGGFGIWSLRLSHDAREVTAGASDGQLFVYDIEARRTVLRVNAHRDDVNAVAFGSASDNNLLLSGSDDSFVKVWDRRSLEGERPSGTLVGHTEGITFVAPKGDGRYVLSNGKDQGMKLWDLRMMTSDADFDRLRLDRKFFGIEGWDYRQSYYAKPRYQTHPYDNSIMTYRGHAVLRTLIRCHWSPITTTSQQYVYSGSSDGRIRIYSLDGPCVATLDRANTHPLMQPKTGEYNDPSSHELRTSGLSAASGRKRRGIMGGMSSTVRDVSWHPYEPKMMSTAWEGRGSVEGSIALHEWAGKRGETLEDQVERGVAEARG